MHVSGALYLHQWAKMAPVEVEDEERWKSEWEKNLRAGNRLHWGGKPEVMLK